MIPNFLVLIAAAFIPFFIAFAWYHPSLFGGDKWTKIAGLTEAQAKNPVKVGNGMIQGIFPGVICFVIPIIDYVVIFERKSTNYLLVTGGFWLISMVLMGAVICKWGWSYV